MFSTNCVLFAEMAVDTVEGGIYVSPEFQLGQVYDGTGGIDEDVVLYRPVYCCVPHEKMAVTNTNNAPTNRKNSSSSQDRLMLNDQGTEDEDPTEKMTSV